eukprot:Hpha_TRINITY_DN15719_c1_g5::TRINITY_DN15719_c1_g5_i2::g.36782::m.36782
MSAKTIPLAAPATGETPKGAIPTHYRPTHAPNFTPPPGTGVGRRGYNLFVGTLPPGTMKDDLEILFSPFGSMSDTYMLKQEGLGGRRCGFVSYAEYASAALAIVVLNGYIVREGEIPICVRFANPVKQREGQCPLTGQALTPKEGPLQGLPPPPPPPPVLATPQHAPQATAPLPPGLRLSQITTPQQANRKRRQGSNGPPSPRSQSLAGRTSSPETASTGNDSFSTMECTPCPSVGTAAGWPVPRAAQRNQSGLNLSGLTQDSIAV